jgi:signal transduction histidine kinase
MQPEPVNILLVDDHPENLLALEALLEGLGQNLVRANSGPEALRCLLSQDFAVILLDVQMPGIDGFETAKLIRARPRSQLTPIIFLTAFSKTDTLVSKGYFLGAVDYLIKPLQPEILRSKVTVFVELFKKTAQVKQQATELAVINQEIQTLNAELEQRVRERTLSLAQVAANLEQRNRELDQFAYVTSHDLKAPLRAIANLSEWIEEDLNDKLTEETRHQMNLLRGRVHRMTALIDGLLQYSRVGRLPSDVEWVSIETLLAEIIDSLAPPPQFAVEIAAGMPTFRTERLALQQVFANLLGNAFKHHHRADGRVQISSQDQGDSYEFAVSDDGPGIEPQFHEKVFGIFQTLEARDKTESTGIGLSLVKKIVEGKGGSIILDSQPGQGATFRFTWPKFTPEDQTEST